MKNLMILFYFLLTGVSYAQTVYENDYVVKVGDLAPDFVINDINGEKYSLSDLRGDVVMLQFTASWCGVCRREMPYIEKEIWIPGKDKGLKVIGIDRDESFEEVVEFKKQVGISYPIALDSNSDIFSKYALKQAGVTRNVIIDRQGRIVFLTRLFRLDEFREMTKLIFEELNKEAAE